MEDLTTLEQNPLQTMSEMQEDENDEVVFISYAVILDPQTTLQDIGFWVPTNYTSISPFKNVLATEVDLDGIEMAENIGLADHQTVLDAGKVIELSLDTFLGQDYIPELESITNAQIGKDLDVDDIDDTVHINNTNKTKGKNEVQNSKIITLNLDAIKETGLDQETLLVSNADSNSDFYPIIKTDGTNCKTEGHKIQNIALSHYVIQEIGRVQDTLVGDKNSDFYPISDSKKTYQKNLAKSEIMLESILRWNIHEKRYYNYLLGESIATGNDNGRKQPNNKTKPKEKAKAKKLTNPKCQRKTRKGDRLKFSCEFCAKTFAKERTIKDHLATHVGEKYKCPHCAFTYKSKSQLTRHYKRCHSDQLFNCHMCAQIFVNFSEYEMHLTTCLCDEAFVRPAVLKRHRCVQVDGEQAKMGHFKREEAKIKQVKSKQVKIKQGKSKQIKMGKVGVVYNCEECGSALEDRAKLLRHMRHKHAPCRFCCELCGKEFVRTDHYQIHMRRHFRRKPCKCNYCGKQFCQKSDLNRHRKFVHLGFVRKSTSQKILGL